MVNAAVSLVDRRFAELGYFLVLASAVREKAQGFRWACLPTAGHGNSASSTKRRFRRFRSTHPLECLGFEEELEEVAKFRNARELRKAVSRLMRGPILRQMEGRVSGYSG